MFKKTTILYPLLILPILCISQVSQTTVIRQEVCWNNAGVDSSLVRYSLVSPQTSQVVILFYTDASGATVLPIGGQYSSGACDCCDGQSGGDNLYTSDGGIQQPNRNVQLNGAPINFVDSSASTGYIRIEANRDQGFFSIKKRGQTDSLVVKYDFGAGSDYGMFLEGPSGLRNFFNGTGSDVYFGAGFEDFHIQSDLDTANTGVLLLSIDPITQEVSVTTNASGIAGTGAQLANTDSISGSFFPTGTIISIQSTNSRWQVVDTIPDDYPVQDLVDNRFVFLDSKSDTVIYLPNEIGFDWKALGMVADWDSTTNTGTNNQAAFFDIVQKLDTGYVIHMSEGVFGWTQATGFQDAQDQGLNNFKMVGDGAKNTRLYFVNGSRPFEIFNAKKVEARGFYATTYDPIGQTAILDLFRVFNADSFLVKGIEVDSMNIIYTDRGRANTQFWQSGSSNIDVVQCKSRDSDNAILFRYSEDVRVLGCDISDSSGDGVKFNKYTQRFDIAFNNFTSNGDDNIDVFGGGFNGTIRFNKFDEGQLEIKAQSKANVGDNVTIYRNQFVNGANVNNDGSFYVPLLSEERFVLNADGTVQHDLNTPDSTYIEIYAFEQNAGPVSFDLNNSDGNSFDFSLTSGSYPVTVIVQYTPSQTSAAFRDTLSIPSGTDTIQINPGAGQELNFGVPQIVSYTKTDYSVNADTIGYFYSTWGDTISLTFPTTTIADKWIIIQTGMDGLTGFELVDNVYENGQIYVGNGAVQGRISSNKILSSEDRELISLPYPLQTLEVSDNRLIYVDTTEIQSTNAAIVGNSASLAEGIQPEGSRYVFRENKILNSSRASNFNNLDQFKGVSRVFVGNNTEGQKDAVSLSGALITDGGIVVDTLYYIGRNRVEYRYNSFTNSTIGLIVIDSTVAQFLPLVLGQNEVIEMGGFTLKAGEVGGNDLFVIDDGNDAIGIGVDPSTTYTLEVGRNAANGFVAQFGRESGGAILADRRTRMSINGSWEINSVEQSGETFSVDNNSWANAGVTTARVNSSFDISGTPTTGDLDMSRVKIEGTVTRTGDTNGRVISLHVDNTSDSGANLVALLLESDSGEGIVVEGASVNSTFEGTVTIESTIWLNTGQTLGIFTGSGTPEGAVTADVGSTFHRTDGGASTSYYVKESGTGNTGWVAK